MDDRQKTKERLDYVFSYYIRLRDSVNGRVYCPCCRKWLPWRESQNMHFISRNIMRYRYDEENCFAGCKHCNVQMGGNYIPYTLFIVRKIGIDKAEEIYWDRKTYKIKTRELEEMIELYANKFNEMAKEKNVDLYFKKTIHGNFILKDGKSNTLGV